MWYYYLVKFIWTSVRLWLLFMFRFSITDNVCCCLLSLKYNLCNYTKFVLEAFVVRYAAFDISVRTNISRLKKVKVSLYRKSNHIISIVNFLTCLLNLLVMIAATAYTVLYYWISIVHSSSLFQTSWIMSNGSNLAL